MIAKTMVSGEDFPVKTDPLRYPIGLAPGKR